MHLYTAAQVADALDGHDDLEVSVGNEWVSAKQFASGTYEESANYWRKFKNINVLVRDFSAPCQSPTCPYMGSCTEMIDNVACRR